MTRRWAFALSALAVLSFTACEEDFQDQTGVDGTEAFERYVSIGTSISMGTQSGLSAVRATGQANAWPALLADQAFASFSSPLIQPPGCLPPFIAPLQFFRRLDGTSVAQPTTFCAELYPSLQGQQPFNNVAIDGARAADALNATPESNPKLPIPLYARVLAPGQTQVTAMLAQDPTFVSVEIGANEALAAILSGVLVPPGVLSPTDRGTFVPNEVWQPDYDAIIEAVQQTGARALLVTVPQVSSIVSLRTGAELWAERAQFAARGVTVSEDCNTAPGSANLIFVPGRVLGALGAAAAGQPNTLSCANVPNAVDYTLTAGDVAFLQGLVEGMNTHIEAVAAENDYAVLDANAVLGFIVESAPPFSVSRLLSCAYPFGQYISLDGVHPNNAGHQLIANAAAQAINAQYGFEIPQNPVPELTSAELCPNSP